MVTEEIKNRKGARKAQDIPKNVQELLDKGKMPTVNLTEWLAVNQIALINNTFPKIGLKGSIDTIENAIREQKKPSTMDSIKIIGLHLYEHCRKSKSLASAIELLSNHTSDTVRCYATYLIAWITNSRNRKNNQKRIKNNREIKTGYNTVYEQ